MCIYHTDYGCVDKKTKDAKKTKATKECVIKRQIKCEDYKRCLENNYTKLRSQKRFKKELNIVFMENINKIVLSANDEKIWSNHHIHMLHLISIRYISYPYGTGPGRVCKTVDETPKSKKLNKMINVGKVTWEYTEEHNLHSPQIPAVPYRILIVGGSGSGKMNALLNLINHQPDIDKSYLYAKDLYDSKY